MRPNEFVAAIHRGQKPEYDLLRFQKVAQRGRGIVAEARYTGNVDYHALPKSMDGYGILAYFPKPEHAEALSESVANLPKEGELQELFPGAVGMLHYMQWPPQRCKPAQAWIVTAIQGCFDRKTVRRLKGKTRPYYPEWKAHLLRHLFEKAQKKEIPNVQMQLTPLTDEENNEIRDEKGHRVFHGAGNAETFTKIADEAGYDVFSIITQGQPAKVIASRRASNQK